MLSSKERMLTAIALEEPDRVPLHLRLFHFRPPKQIAWRDDIGRAKTFLSMGIDDILWVSFPVVHDPGVRIRRWKEKRADAPYPILHKVYETPAGGVHHAVKQTGDWPHGDDVPLLEDFNVPRSERFPVASEEDVEALPYLLGLPRGEQLEQVRRNAEGKKRDADRLGVLLAGCCTSTADAALWLCGAEWLLTTAFDNPQLIERLLGIIQQWSLKRLELFIDYVDVVMHRAWYESPDFWSPPMYRKFLLPLLDEEARAIHGAGKLLMYVMTSGLEAHLDNFSGSHMDLLWGVDPVQGRADLHLLKSRLGRKMAMMGGMNSAITLGRGTETEIREAVRQAVRIMAPGGGFILSPVDALYEDTPWSAVETMINEWKKLCHYPISL